MSIVSKILQFVPVKKPQLNEQTEAPLSVEPIVPVGASVTHCQPAAPVPPSAPASKPESKPKRPYRGMKKRADGRYCKSCVYIDSNGLKRRKSIYGDTPAETRAKYDAFKAELREQAEAAKPENILVSDWIDRFLPTYRSTIQPNTAYQYGLYLARIKAAFGTKRLCEVTLDDCQALMNTLNDKSSTSISKLWSLLRSCFGKAKANRLILHDPTEGVEVPKGTKGTHRSLDDTEQETVAATWSGHPFGCVAMLMNLAGLRIGEALAFNPETDVVWNTGNDKNINIGHINVAHSLRFDCRTSASSIVSPKTEAGYRSIPILSKELAAVVRSMKGSALVNADGSRLDRNTFRRIYRAYLKYLRLHGCAQHIRCHDFRHTFCTRLCSRGVNIKTAQRWMGHVNSKTTMDVYAHFTKERELEDVKLMLAS